MLDANATEHSDSQFSEFIATCALYDLHIDDPAPSTFIGSSSRRIDFMLGCSQVQQFCLRSGTLSYCEGPQSDHRSLFVDLDLTGLKCSQENISHASARVLHTGNPELVSAYNQKMIKYYMAHHMIDRIDKLYDSFRDMPKADIRLALIKWDNDQGRAMAMGERCLAKPTKKYKWSPTLRNTAKLRLYWKLWLREVETNANYAATFDRWERQIRGYDPNFCFPQRHDHLSPASIRKEFNKASAVFRKCQLEAIPTRLKCYEQLLEKYEEDSTSSTGAESRRKAQIVRNTIDGEVLRSKFRDIRRVMKPTTATSLSKLMIPRLESDQSVSTSDVYRHLQETDPQDLIWETVVERDQLERHLLDYNSTSFRAASISPCGHGVIHDALTFSSLSPSSIRLLEGETPAAWHDDDLILREFLASFTIPESVRSHGDIPTEITSDEVIYGFTKWRETTSTSPSGRHLGHYRSLIQHPVLLSCMVKFLNIAVQSGISVPRRSNAVNVLIEKDPGKPKINRLRIIHLFEADWNFFLKLQWGHRLVRRAVALDLLHDGQHGSIPRRMALDPIMLTQLTTDLCRILKHDFARFDNDASACYDRIIIALAMLAARKCGMPMHAVQTHADALLFMRYTVKTIYGVSEETYQGTDFAPLFGTGQGSGASPAAWLSLVVILLQTLDRIIPDRINFSSPNGEHHHSRLADAFVDDTYLGFTSSSDDATFEDLVSRLQRIAQTWEHLLFLSGGKLNLSKCSWYILCWEWDKGRPVLRPIKPMDPTITLHEGPNIVKSTPIKRTSPEVSQRMLGVFLNPMGDFGHHIQALKRKADQFATRLLSPRLTAGDVRIFHRTTYIPSMRYGLASVAVDEEALGQIQSKIVQAILKKIHVQSTIPTAIRHGPVEFGGLDIYDLRTEAGLEAIKFLRNAVYSGGENGKLVRMNLQYSQIEAGIELDLLEHPGIHVPYLTSTWLMSIRQYLYCHNMTITITNGHAIKLAGPTDQVIMQAQHLSRYSSAQQRDINLVRLYLQVHTLAEMSTNTKRKAIDLSYLDAQRPEGFVLDATWPRQATPSKAQRRLWKRYIRSSFLRYVPYWIENPISDSSPEATPAAPSPTQYEAFADYLKSLPSSHQRLLDQYTQVATDVQVWKAFRSKRRLHLGTDGGLAHQKGTHGWVLSTKSNILFHGAGPVDGPYDTSSSTRSELGGYAAALILIRALSRFWGLKHRSKFWWYCDSKSAISRVHRYASRNSTPHQMPPDADLISLIRVCHADIRYSVRAQWVKGHQDTYSTDTARSLASRLNIRADALATAYRLHGRLKSSPKCQHVEEQQCSISINGRRLTSQYDESIRFHINGYHLRTYIQDKHGWTDSAWDSVDFHLFGRHFRRLTQAQQATWMKIVHDQLPLGERRYQQAPVKDDLLRKCPCCKTEHETMRHFLTCSSNPSSTSSLCDLLPIYERSRSEVGELK